ncbi:MAG: TetR-like C-terminal domain-containing protein [Anaerolineaceae bacterium]
MRNKGELKTANRDEICIRICDALEKLVQTKNLSEISVVELCRLSGVPRSTFYSHYCDIYAVPQWLWDKMNEEAVYRIGDSLTWDQGHRFMFRHLLEHKAFFTKIYWESDHNSITEYGYRGGFNAIKANVENRKNHIWTEVELVELDYVIKALAALTTKWGRDGMVVPVETVVHIFNTHIPEFLKELCDT